MKLTLITILILSAMTACGKVPSQNSPDKPGTDTDPETPVEFSDSIIVLDLRSYNALNPSNISDMKKLWDTMHAVASVQGIVNRDTPRLYINYVTNGSKEIDSYWWNKYRKSGEWLSDVSWGKETDVMKVIEYFRPLIKGLVVWDPNLVSTSNVASTVAGADDLIAVRWDPSKNSMYTKLREMGLEVKVWLVSEDGSPKFTGKLAPYEWALENYLETGKCSPEFAAYYIDAFWISHAAQAATNHHCLTNHDFFIAKKAFFFDLSPWEDEVATDDPDGEVGGDYRLLCRILKLLYEKNGGGNKFCHIGGFPAWAFKYTRFSNVGGSHGEVDTEWEFARIISAYNAFKDADAINLGAMANGSFWTKFPLEAQYPQKWTTVEELKAKGYVKADGTVDTSKKYFIYYVGDFDAASWLYQMTPDLWDNTSRRKLPMMWSISPVLAVRAPMAMHYIRKTASSRDYFAAADNGAGYLNPSMLQGDIRPVSGLPSGIDQWVAHCKPYYEQWGLTVTGFIIDGFADQMDNECLKGYSTFSPNGIVIQKCDRLASSVNGMPILRSGPDINDADPDEAAATLASYLLHTHPDFPFYWARAILKTPEWYLGVKDIVEGKVSNVEWVDAPTFFELLRIYIAEGKPIPVS